MANAATAAIGASERRAADSLALGAEGRAAMLPQAEGAAERAGRLAPALGAAERLAAVAPRDDGGDSGDAAAEGAAGGAGRLAVSRGRERLVTSREKSRRAQEARKAAGVGAEGEAPEPGRAGTDVPAADGASAPGPTSGTPRAAAPLAKGRREAPNQEDGRGARKAIRRAGHTGKACSPLSMRQARENQEAEIGRAHV